MTEFCSKIDRRLPIASSFSTIKWSSFEKYLKKIQSKKLNNVVDKIMTSDNYLSITDVLRRIQFIFNGNTEYRTMFFEVISDNNLELLLTNGHLKLAELINLNLLPTPSIFETFFSGAISVLEKNKKDIENGGFNILDQLHIELEYSKFCLVVKDLKRKYKYTTLAEFSKLSYSLNNIPLSLEQREEIENVAYDNLAILNFIKEESKKGKVLVLFNKRYGDDYVGKAIQTSLEGNSNIKIDTIYVSSSEYDEKRRFDKIVDNSGIFTADLKSFIETAEPTIIVVDGTSFKIYNEGLQRFPAAMTKVIHDVKNEGYNNLRFWIPNVGNITSKVMVGNWREEIPCTNPGSKTLIVIRATGKSKGILDDPEDQVKKKILVFSDQGVKEIQPTNNIGILTGVFIKMTQESTRRIIMGIDQTVMKGT